MNACNTIATFEQYILSVESLSKRIFFNSLCAKLMCLSIQFLGFSFHHFLRIFLTLNHVMGLSSLLGIIMVSNTCTVFIVYECSEEMQ